MRTSIAFRGIVTVLLSCLSLGGIIAQSLTQWDSLENLVWSAQDPEVVLHSLEILAEDHPDTRQKLIFGEELIHLATEYDSSRLMIAGYLQTGNALRLRGDLTQALTQYFEALKIAFARNRLIDQALVNITIADVYSIMGNHPRSTQYYREAIAILREEGDTLNLASAILNAGDEYFNREKLDTALLYFQESGALFKALNFELGLAYNLGNIGLVYAKQNRENEAEGNMTQAVELLTKLEEFYPICVYLASMSDIYLKKGESEKAMQFAHESLVLAQQYELKEQIGDAHLKISELHEAQEQMDSALWYYKEYIRYRDSVVNISSVQQMASLRSDFEIAQKQNEVDLLNAQQQNQKLIVWFIGVALLLLGLLAVGLYRRFLFIKRTKSLIESEKNRSEKLLLNILPKETAEELKSHGTVQAKRFEQVSVLFSDFKNFTPYAEKLPPEALVKTVDHYFSKFDEIMDRYGIEKIKTIGDAYMAASGLPFPSDDHAVKMVKAAQDMVRFVQETLLDPELKEAQFEVRIGINTGPVVAGVVGTKKFAYDIWGNTVNIAARLETHSEPGQINISQHTYDLVKDVFVCSHRGEIELKNTGPINMYFVGSGT